MPIDENDQQVNEAPIGSAEEKMIESLGEAERPSAPVEQPDLFGVATKDEELAALAARLSDVEKRINERITALEAKVELLGADKADTLAKDVEDLKVSMEKAYDKLKLLISMD